MYLLTLLGACLDDSTYELPSVEITRSQTVDLDISHDSITGLLTSPDESGCVVASTKGNLAVFPDGTVSPAEYGVVPEDENDFFTTTGDAFIYDDGETDFEFTIPGCAEKSILGVASVKLTSDDLVEGIFNAKEVSSPWNPIQGVFTFFGSPENNSWTCDVVEQAASQTLLPIVPWKENEFCALTNSANQNDGTNNASLTFYSSAE